MSVDSRATTRDAALGRPTGTPNADSLPTRLCDLQVGDSESRSKLVREAGVSDDDIQQIKRTLEQTVRKAVSRAKERSGYGYVVDSGQFPCRDGYISVTSVATRTA